MNNNEIMFVTILKSSNMDQNMKQELLDLHSRQSELEAKIKMQKYMEYKYNQLKIEELNERIDEMKFQSKFFIKRNNNILEEINKNDISSFELASSSNQILENLIRSKNNYQNYLNSLKPKILNQFNEQILQNNLLSKELNNIRENEKKSNYYKQLINYNDKMLKEIDILKKKNDLLISQNKEKEKILLEKEQQKLNTFIESDVDKEEILKSQNDGSYLNLMPNKSLLKQYVLNINHKYGKLDELKEEQIKIINEQIKKEYNQRNNNIKDLLNDSQNSLDDLRNQIFPSPKFYNPNFLGTLEQKFHENIENDKPDVNINQIKLENEKANVNINQNKESKLENDKPNVNINQIKKSKIENEKANVNINQNKESINKSNFRLLDSNIENKSKKIERPIPIPLDISIGSNSEYKDCEVKVIEDKNEEEKKNQDKLEEIKESQKEENDDNSSFHKIDNEEKKEKELKETDNGEEKKEIKDEEIDDDNGSNHKYDDFIQEEF